MTRILATLSALLLAATASAGTVNYVRSGNPQTFTVGTGSGTIAAGDDPRLIGTSVYSADAYGAVGDGATDDCTPVQNAINAAGNAATGGSVTFQGKTYRINCQLTFPQTSDTIPKQRPIRLIGAGPHFSGVGSAPYGGTILDLRSTASDGKIVTYGIGYLEIANVTITDNGTSTNPYVYTTNTTLHIHDSAFIGNPTKSGVSCDQDVIVLGGTSATFGGGGHNDGFQGYGTVISGNYFNRVRRAVYGRVYFNANVIRDNTIWATSGSGLAGGAAIELDGTSASGAAATQNYIAGNLIELTNYPYGVKLVYGNYNTLIGNLGFDATGTTLATVRVDATAAGNLVIGGPSPGGAVHYISDAGSSRYVSNESAQATKLGPIALYDEGGVATTIPRVTFTGGDTRTTIQPAATQTSGQIQLQVLRSAAEGTNPGGTVASLTYAGTLTLGNGDGTTGAVFSNFGKTWTGAVGAGGGGNMIQNSGSGGSVFTAQNFRQDWKSQGGTLLASLGGAISLFGGNTAFGLASAGTVDTVMTSEAADTLSLGRSTNAQTLRIYNTYTSGTNYERARLNWVSNAFEVATEKGSSGTNRDINIKPATGVLNVTGNVVLTTAGNGVLVKEGTNATTGTATCNGTTEVTVSTTKATATAGIFLGGVTPGGTPSAPYLSTKTAGTSFGFKCGAGDTSSVRWFIVEAAP